MALRTAILSITTNFAGHFELTCKSSKRDHNEALKAEYKAYRAKYFGSPLTDQQAFDVELLSKLINNLKCGKAAGFDELTSEHFQFSHPTVVSILVKLFNLFILRVTFQLASEPVILCPFLNVTVALKHCLLMTSGVFQFALSFLNYLKWPPFLKGSQIT